MHKSCDACKFAGDRGCAVAPHYWKRFHLLPPMSPDARNQVMVLIAECDQFEADESIGLQIELTKAEWMKLVSLISSDDPQAALRLKAQIEKALDLPDSSKL